MKTKGTLSKTQALVMSAILTALVIILQFLGSFIHLGPFSISLVLLPIVIGAAACGASIGAWLGFMFGVVVLISGDAAAFLAVNPLGTISTVLLKGTLCGLSAGLVFKALEKTNAYLATVAAAVVCPIVNTGIFLIGCFIFFMETITGWAMAFGFGEDVGGYIIYVMVGINFLAEFFINIILSPIVVRLLKVRGLTK